MCAGVVYTFRLNRTSKLPPSTQLTSNLDATETVGEGSVREVTDIAFDIFIGMGGGWVGEGQLHEVMIT